MLQHSLLSGGLLLFPVVLTVGIYLGVDSQRIFHGGFKGGYGVPTDLSNQTRIETTTYCQKAYGITPTPGRYTFNPNQWGLSDTDASGLCMNITTNNSVPITDHSASPFTATWQYPQGPATEPVHAFPNAKYDVNSTIPLQVSNMSSLDIDVAWSYTLGSKVDNSTNSTLLSLAGVNANVCVDMFLASDKEKSTLTTDAAYEVMVWIGRWGVATQPIGILQGSKDSFAVNGTTFNLYAGSNSLGQKVFTWVADRNTTRFVGDISPLVTRLSSNGGPVAADYLGYVAFGSEALYSFENVTFSVPELQMDLNPKTTG